LKKKASPFRFFYEQFLVQQDFGKFPPEWDKSFLAFIKHKRKILRSLQEKGVDIGYVLSVLLDIAWTIRIPPLGKEKNFWESRKKPIQESIDAMKDFSPRYFKQEIIEGVEKGLEKLAWKSEDSYMYFGVNEHIVIVGSSRRGKGRVKEDRLNNTIARLDYYFKKAKIHYRPQRIAELLNACLRTIRPIILMNQKSTRELEDSTAPIQKHFIRTGNYHIKGIMQLSDPTVTPKEEWRVSLQREKTKQHNIPKLASQRHCRKILSNLHLFAKSMQIPPAKL
jgi:hypothetical protein